MTAKMLLPNQCTPLHFLYGHDNCCLCKANQRIREFEEKVRELESQINIPWDEKTGVRVENR